MSFEKTDSLVPNNDTAGIHGSGSVAHQIIGGFLAALGQNEDYREIAQNLKVVIFDGKPTETAIRTALFGEEPL